MNMLALNSRLASRVPHWSELATLSREDKIAVIAFLSMSMAEGENASAPKKDRTQEMIERCCGSWAGEQSAEEIIGNINRSKKSKAEPVKFE